MSAPRPPDPSHGFRRASQIGSRPVEWLWPGRLALGKLAILEGDPGLGKSFLALDLCARLSTGRPWPDGAPAGAPAACVYLSGEDGAKDTLGPRLRALGADLDYVLLPDGDDGDLVEPLSLPDQTGGLERVVAEARPRLVVIDPVMSFFGPKVDTSRDPSVRRALAPLVALAGRHGCAVLLVRHLNKREGMRALYRGLGAVGLVGACRSAWLVAEEAEGSGRRVLAQVKNNLAAPQPALAFEVVRPEGGPSALNWLGPVPVTADGLLAPRRRAGREPRERRDAEAFLTRVLAGGPLTVNDVWERARKEGVSLRTLRRAKDELGVRAAWVKAGGRRVSYWLLGDQEPPSGDVAGADPNSLEPWLRPLRERFPGPTPLDDL